MDASRIAVIPFFAGLPAAELEAVAAVARPIDFAPGDQITREGDLGHVLFVLEAGEADVTVGGEKVAEVGAGALVGEVAVLASGRRTASVTARTPVDAVAIFKRDAWRLEESAPEASRRLRAAIDDRPGLARG